MAGYFSNHSQPQTRFSSQQPQHGTANNHQDPPRPRLPASRHFSTSLANRDPEPALTKATASPPSSGTVHPLRNTYVRAHIHLPSPCLLFSAPPRSKSYLVGFSGSASSVRQEIRSRVMRRGSKKSHPFPQSVSVLTPLSVSLNPSS